jgi:hypothetical protein
MKLRAFVAALALIACLGAAETATPNLKSLLSEQEWRRAGLDRLSPSELAVIDAALARQLGGPVAAAPAPAATRATNGTAAAATTASRPASVPGPATTAAATQATAPAAAPGVASISAPSHANERRSGFWEKYTLPKLYNDDWKSIPPMVAKVTAWQGGNGFVLDNGQVWEGVEPIPFELPGREVTIEARPGDSYALRMGEKSTVVRVRRVR